VGVGVGTAATTERGLARARLVQNAVNSRITSAG
jgi:hypothetical protein